MNDFDTIRAVLDHAQSVAHKRVGAISVAGAPSVRLRDDDVSGFQAWVASLSSRSPVHGELGANRAVLSVVGLIRCGRRVSVTVDVRADLLRRNDLVGFLSAHELARLAPVGMGA
ncbi:hypothetical protein L3Q65_45875 [Amycolatopsis sp. FU40]|uniref:hypothetical protein n=1 Tax=Amycolatopsis sp. FU40 TaxID=2914159 RepID=UPI001F41D34C|nr:hypothetical protein [Amycolatopsis sp. FU40]UKD55104.1 hypothetical protein L3Q65_45875 [Amycolatopsis sp. FU40]